MDIRTALRGLGKTCVAAGMLILLFVAYQLWGTGIAEAHAQSTLKKQFAALSAPTTTAAPATTAAPLTTTAPVTSTSPPTTAVALPPAPTGSAVAIIKIPKIGVDSAVVEGVGVSDLEKGPGHYPGSPLPGQAGNAAIAGHRTTYGAPFYRLNELKPGDDIYVSTQDSPKAWHYQVEFSHSVDPSDVSVLDPTLENRLTLTTCTPRFSASQRLIVVARLLGPVDPRPPATTRRPPAAATGLGAPDVSTAPTGPAAADNPAVAATGVGSLSGQGTSTVPAIVWGAVCAALWILAWGIGHVWRRWTAYALATPVFLLCLYFFFENFARFVPGNM